jgi:hypothetical protein
MRLRFIAASVALLAACTADTTADRQAANIAEQGPGETCSATLSVWQKDAYKETAGRTSALWPPHTTTTLTVSCAAQGQDAPQVVQVAEMENHGTKVGAEDANGDHILVETARSEAVRGERGELLRLAASFGDCECDGATTFLSMDSLDDESVGAIVESLTNYMQANLACDDEMEVSTLVSLLQKGAIPEALAALEHCDWQDGSDIETGLNAALQQLAGDLQNTLADYHLCNNDAKLQVELFQGFEQSRSVKTCDKTNPICSGPLWFYEPTL